MVVALTVTPALALILLSRAPLSDRESPLVRWLQRVYTGALTGMIHKPRTVYAERRQHRSGRNRGPAASRTRALPSFKERDFLMHWLTKPGTSRQEEVRITAKAYNELSSIPGVRNFGSHIGQALIMDEVYGVYFGENWISIDPKVDYDKTLAAVQSAVDGYPGLVRDVQTYLKERIREVLTGSHEPITVRIFGRELPVLRAKAQEVREALEKIPGIVEAHVESQAEIPQIDIKLNLTAAEGYGIKPGDVRRASAALVAGTEVGDIFRNGKAYDVNVWSTPETRNDLNAIRSLLIDTPKGGTCAPGGRGRCEHRSDSEHDQARADDAQDRRRRQGARARSRVGGGRCQAGAGHGRFPTGVPSGAARRVCGAGGGAEADAGIDRHFGDRNPSACCRPPS